MSSKIIIATFLILILFGLNIDVSALLPPQSNLEKFLNSDTILMGTVDSLKILTVPENEMPQTSYDIKVTRYLKNNLNEQILSVVAMGSTESPPVLTGKIFEKGQNVFLYLIISDGKYIVSPHSVVYLDNFTEFLIPPPLKLLKNGVTPSDIPCKSFHQKVFKPSGIPACVTPETAESLVTRNWKY